MAEPPASGEFGDAAPARQGDRAGGRDSAAGASPPLDCVVLTAANGGEWLGIEQRRQERFAVQSCRPIALRLLNGQGRPEGLWMLADILDISRGGMCLLLSGPLQLPVDQALQMDLRAHPDFGVLRLESRVRWCRGSASFTTLGVGFLENLPRVPRLELERRTRRRDPNNEAWAQD